MGANAVMFSVDYTYESCREAVAGFEQTTLSHADREKVAHGNAERILDKDRKTFAWLTSEDSLNPAFSRAERFPGNTLFMPVQRTISKKCPRT